MAQGSVYVPPTLKCGMVSVLLSAVRTKHVMPKAFVYVTQGGQSGTGGVMPPALRVTQVHGDALAEQQHRHTSHGPLIMKMHGTSAMAHVAQVVVLVVVPPVTAVTDTCAVMRFAHNFEK